MDEIIVTDVDETVETDEFNLGKEIAKSFAVSAAASAGTIAGFLVIGLAVTKLTEIRDRRRAKKNPDQTETPVED